MLKIDIDVFVNIPKLFQEIIKDKKLKHMRDYLLGKCNGCDLKYRGHRRRRPLILYQLGEEYQKKIKIYYTILHVQQRSISNLLIWTGLFGA